VKVKALEKEVTGELYGWHPREEMASKKGLLKGYRFSVSRIAIAVSALVSFFWFGLLLRQSVGWKFDVILESPYWTLGFTLFLGALMGWLTYSDD
jgi:hypothetical protein